MPKVIIDYSNTIIYKICCKDPEIKDIYIGHTTNFVQRKYSHKQTCNNIKSPCYNLKLYKTIRKNGNWSNWDMSIVQFYNCKDLLEARQKEQEQFIAFNATLNSIEPLPCTLKKTHVMKNNNDLIPILDTDIANKYKFFCKKCEFTCFKKGDWNRHNLTLKHIDNEEIVIKNEKTVIKKSQHICICKKEYCYRQGLAFHKKKCDIVKPSSNKDNQTNTSDNKLLKILIKETNELKNIIAETVKLIKLNNNNSTNNM
jgi:hypothetical protein